MNEQAKHEQAKPQKCVCQGSGPALTNILFELLPGEAGSHFRAARIEFLKGLRSLLDSRIEQLSKTHSASDAGTSIPVD